ncbi:hypothetical protein TrRE_jg6136 [Triparma retinervis]|uniref:Uncharacterized protein n=1 Tax=Triparma retinervis TaxID=2557542 RepID=A0A9W6ZE14_9STRA|nr:hypothetical protein TrRE_jg6136 [Triparma retinervis]
MALPYFTETRQGKVAFATVIALTLLNSGVSVAFSYVGRDFYSALSSKDPEQFNEMLLKFSAALTLGVPVSVFYRFQREKLSLEWREWMTARVLDLYFSNGVYYGVERGGVVDNPDQRIAEDVKSFTAFSLTLFITAVTSVIDLASFSAILYSIKPSLFLDIFAYALFGTVSTSYIGRRLGGLNFSQLKKEADFRYALVRVRENAEGIAFYEGEGTEGDEVGSRLGRVVENTGDVIRAQRDLEFFTTAYRYLIQVLPVSAVAPLYFAGAIPLGVVTQSTSAFNHILSDLSVVVNQFESLSQFSAGIGRLKEFLDEVQRQDGERDEGGILQLASATAPASKRASRPSMDRIDLDTDPSRLSSSTSPSSILNFSNVTVSTPDLQRTLVTSLDLSVPPLSHLLIVGNSGAGKSSLLRCIAGLWTSGHGTICRPPNGDCFFLPQKPYCPLGTLREQVLYPSFTNATDAEVLDILTQVDLSSLASRVGSGDAIAGLSATLDWSNTLSLGEQQRLSFARLLANRPRLAVLDEATSALDVTSERNMYEAVGKVPGITYVSVGHRPSLVEYHGVKLRLMGEGGWKVERRSEVEENGGEWEMNP